MGSQVNNIGRFGFHHYDAKKKKKKLVISYYLQIFPSFGMLYVNSSQIFLCNIIIHGPEPKNRNCNAKSTISMTL